MYLLLYPNLRYIYIYFIYILTIISGEANRLVAWLVKHSRNREVMMAIVKNEAIRHLVDMANAEHAVMQNEALVALILISSSILGKFGRKTLL